MRSRENQSYYIAVADVVLYLFHVQGQVVLTFLTSQRSEPKSISSSSNTCTSNLRHIRDIIRSGHFQGWKHEPKPLFDLVDSLVIQAVVHDDRIREVSLKEINILLSDGMSLSFSRSLNNFLF